MAWTGRLILSATVLGAAASLLAPLGYPFELASHFRPQLLVVCLGAMVLLGVRRWWRAVGISAIAVAAVLAPLLTVSFRPIEPAAADTGQPSLSVAWANVWQDPAAARRFVDDAIRREADVIAMGEFPFELSLADVERVSDYQFHVDTEHLNPGRRLVVLSRHPLGQPVFRQAEDGARPWVVVPVRIEGADWRIIASHPLPPGTPDYRSRRNAILAAGANELQAGETIWMGDFNITPWSPDYKKLGLQRIGNPFAESTWLTSLPLLGLPIDHVLVSDDLVPIGWEVGPAIGSDHLPVFAVVQRQD